MRPKRILRTTIGGVMIGLLLTAWLGPGLASASGGGGCGRPVTDARGTTITIRSFCFTPTIIRIRVGQTVTWANRDPFSHTVMGANAVWGSFALVRRTSDAQYRFTRPGVYPYVCTIHPGMVGAVVVGSARGPGAAGVTTTSSGPVTLVLPSPTPLVDPPMGAASVGAAALPARVGPAVWRMLAIVTSGLLLALAASFLIAGRRRRAEAS